MFTSNEQLFSDTNISYLACDVCVTFAVQTFASNSGIFNLKPLEVAPGIVLEIVQGMLLPNFLPLL